MYSNKEAENQMIFERINWNLLHLLYAFQLFPKDLLSNCVLMFIYAFEREFCFKVAKQKCVPRLVSFHLTLASRFSAFSLSFFLSTSKNFDRSGEKENHFYSSCSFAFQQVMFLIHLIII